MGKGEGVGEGGGEYRDDRDRDRDRRNRNRNSNRGGGGDDCGCSCCQPCCGCIALKIASLICTIIWCVLSVLFLLLALSSLKGVLCNRKKEKCYRDNEYGIVTVVVWILLCVAMLAAAIIGIIGSRRANRCKVHFFCFASVLVCIISMTIAIGLIIWCFFGGYDSDDYGCFDDGWFFYYSLFWVFFMWYPWWVVYAYYIELGGKSWFNCDC